MTRYGYLLPTRSIVLSSDDETALAARADSEVVGLARRAEAMGFASVWVGDSVLARPRLEALSTLAAVAGATEAVDLGTAVYLPALRHPVHVAHQTATIDQLSGGRLALGVGVGSKSVVESEHANLGVDYAARGARMDELLDAVTALWEGEPVGYDGEFVRLEDASIGFGPIRDPPIYIPTGTFDPSSGLPAPIRDRVVAYGDGVMPIGIEPETYRDSLAEVRSQLADAGRDPDSLDAAYYFDAVIDRDEDAALEEAREFYDRYYPTRGRLSDEEIRVHGAFGPAADVAERLDAYVDAGVETMVVRFTARDQRTQLRRFVDLVR